MVNQHDNNISIEQMCGDLSRSLDTIMAMESLRSHLVKSGSPSEKEKRLISIAAEMAVTGTEVSHSALLNPNRSDLAVSLENRINLSMEGLADSFKKLLNDLVNKIKNFRFDSKTLKEKIELVEERLAKLRNSKSRDAIVFSGQESELLYIGTELTPDLMKLSDSNEAFVKTAEAVLTSVVKTTKLFADQDDMLIKTKDLEFLQEFTKKLFDNMMKMCREIISSARFTKARDEKDSFDYYKSEAFLRNFEFHLIMPDIKKLDWKDKHSVRKELTEFYFYSARVFGYKGKGVGTAFAEVDFNDLQVVLDRAKDFSIDVQSTINNTANLWRELPQTVYNISRQDFEQARDDLMFWKFGAYRLFLTNVMMVDKILSSCLGFCFENHSDLVSLVNRMAGSYEWKRS